MATTVSETRRRSALCKMVVHERGGETLRAALLLGAAALVLMLLTGSLGITLVDALDRVVRQFPI